MEKYYRTQAEAFKTMEYGACIEKPLPKMFTKLELIVYFAAVVVILLDMFVWRP
jgi:hypothetical protein